METKEQVDLWLFLYGMISVLGFGVVLYLLWLTRSIIAWIFWRGLGLALAGGFGILWVHALLQISKHWR